MENRLNVPGFVQGVPITSLTRADVLGTLAYFMEVCGNKVSRGRAPRDYDADRCTREWCRCGIYACTAALSGIRDADSEISEELQAQVSELRERVLS